LSLLSTSVVDTGANLLLEPFTLVANLLHGHSHQVNLRKDVTTGVVDTSSKFSAFINDTGVHLAAVIAATHGAL
jgi:hypothetical protein